MLFELWLNEFTVQLLLLHTVDHMGLFSFSCNVGKSYSYCDDKNNHKPRNGLIFQHRHAFNTKYKIAFKPTTIWQ